MEKRICVVGAGVAGLSSARRLLEAGQHVTVLESTAHVGGTWRYEPRVGLDQYGRPIYTSMYKHLRTNLPKQTMEFPGFPMPADMPSYPSGHQFYEYLKSFADHFDLKKHIKFLHEVILISRVGEHWTVKYRSVVTDEEFEETYDYVFICTGHYSKPALPNLPGEKLFNGTIIHSHDYREAEPYRDRRVLVVGAGPSAMDIGLYLADTCRKLISSHHSKVHFRTPFPDNYVQKPDVQEFTEHGVRFKDGTYEDIDDVIYCTGFEYNYPFLDETSALSLHPRSVSPLYRQLVNIHQPTMLILGLLVKVCAILAIDAQARYGAALVSGNFSLPSEEQMIQDWQARLDYLLANGKKFSDIHLLAADEDRYYANLTAESGIARVPPVLVRLRGEAVVARLENLYTYRDYRYTVLDGGNFTRTCEPPVVLTTARPRSRAQTTTV